MNEKYKDTNQSYYISGWKSFLIMTFEESFILYVLCLHRVKGSYILSRVFLSIILGQWGVTIILVCESENKAITRALNFIDRVACFAYFRFICLISLW